MNRLEIESSIPNNVTFSESVNRLKIEFTDPHKVNRTSKRNEIDIRKQGTESVLIMCKTNTKELIVKQKSKELRTIQTK
tara:strand:+ start:1770 stop:2006 length:237 start_codon:yes stop_codon:yes gene_type:complete